MNYKKGDSLVAKQDFKDDINQQQMFTTGKLYIIQEIKDNGCYILNDDSGVIRSMTLHGLDRLFGMSHNAVFDDAMSILE